MIRKLQDLSGIDPNDIPMDDAGVMALFSGTDILGVTEEQIRYAELVCWGFRSLGPILYGAVVDENPIRTTFCRALTAIWSLSWYGRLAGQCSRLDQARDC